MRRAFIAFGIVVFLVYCWASVAYQNQVRVPDYKLVEVNLLGGISRARWNADPQSQFQQLMALENRRYQLPVGAKVKAPAAAGEPAWPSTPDAGKSTQPGAGKSARPSVVGADGYLSADHPLTSDDFAAMIAAAPPGDKVMVELRDTTAIFSLVGRNFLLRDPIYDPQDPRGRPLFVAGQPITKELVDRLLAADISVITITGQGATVSFELGTSLMIAVIFLTLVAALKPIIWHPFMTLLDKRLKELEMGAEAERQNQLESARYMEEEKRRRGELHREIQEIRMRDQRETAKQAGLIVKEARDREKRIKLQSLRELGASAASAREKLEKDIPALAEAVADALTPGGERPRRNDAAADENDGQQTI